jgi:HSP20 family protein
MTRQFTGDYPTLYGRNELYAPMNSWFDQMMTNFFPELKPFDFNSIKSRAYPKVDIRKDGEDILIEASVPFLKKENLNISLDKNILIISGKIERLTEDEKQNYYHSELTKSSFSRSLPIDLELFEKWNSYGDIKGKIDAYLKDGILSIKLLGILKNSTIKEFPQTTLIPIRDDNLLE